jgi:hypothetical protein
MDANELKPCAHCGAELEPFGPDQANHPVNECWLSSVRVLRNEFDRWNRRAPVSPHTAGGERQSIDSDDEFKRLLGKYGDTLATYIFTEADEEAFIAARRALIAHIHTWAGRSAGDAVLAEKKQADELNVMPPFAAPAGQLDAKIEAKQAQLLREDLMTLQSFVNDLDDGSASRAFYNVRASVIAQLHADEMASRCRVQGGITSNENGSGAAHLVEQVGEQKERAMIETRAKEIYGTFVFADRYPWVDGGNSIRQDDARDQARAELFPKVGQDSANKGAKEQA